MFATVLATAQVETKNNKNVKNESYVIRTVSVEKTGYKNFVATAYSLRGRTASGEMVRQGIIAADPRILPLGTVVHIDGLGTYIVKDTGGGIKGARIDIWMPSRSNAIQFGRRGVKIKIISMPQKKIRI